MFNKAYHLTELLWCCDRRVRDKLGEDGKLPVMANAATPSTAVSLSLPLLSHCGCACGFGHGRCVDAKPSSTSSDPPANPNSSTDLLIDTKASSPCPERHHPATGQMAGPGSRRPVKEHWGLGRGDRFGLGIHPRKGHFRQKPIEQWEQKQQHQGSGTDQRQQQGPQTKSENTAPQS